MPFDPVESDVVPSPELIERLPQILILHRLLARRLPAALFPLVEPLFEAIQNVLAIAGKFDSARRLERTQPLDHGSQLHPVVGGFTLGAVPLARLATRRVFEDVRPPARPGIARAGAVSKQFNMRQ